MSFEEKLEQVKSVGHKRLVEILKILISEYPRLEKGFFSEDGLLKRKTNLEVIYIVDVIEKELRQIGTEQRKPPYQVWMEIFQPQNFTVSELDVLKKALEIFRKYSKNLQSSSSKPSLRFRGKKV
jgi:hypothetical protein